MIKDFLPIVALLYDLEREFYSEFRMILHSK